MDGIPPLDDFTQINPAWLTEILRRAGDLDRRGEVAAFRLEWLSGTRGYMSGIIRLHLDYEGPRGTAPDTLIVKLPPAAEERYAIGASLNLFEREMRFYRDISADAVLRVPRCYYAGKTEAPRSTMIVMEDAWTWRVPDQITGLDQETLRTLLDGIAAMHARWWLSPRLEGFTWLPSVPVDLTQLYGEVWPSFLDSFGSLMTAEQIRMGERIAAVGPAFLKAIQEPPWTLVHSDIRADNLLVEGPDPPKAVMVLDWQTVSRSKGAVDAARLVAGSLTRQLEEADFRLFAYRWHGQLTEGGVAHYSPDQAWQDFRLGIVNAAYFPVCFHGNLANEGKRGRDLMEALVRRIFHAAVTCDALSALDRA
ncbi:MAG: phosphotransferase [Pseudomonadota bacterium]